jgi:hypothetical protein
MKSDNTPLGTNTGIALFGSELNGVLDTQNISIAD